MILMWNVESPMCVCVHVSGQIWLHVRSAGHWTNKLYKYFDEYEQKEELSEEELCNRNKRKF